MAAVQTHLIVFDQEVSGRVEDHCVESIRVQGQSVVVVKAVDVHLGQTHLVVGVNSGGVEEVAGAWRNQFWQHMGNQVDHEESQTAIQSDWYQRAKTIRRPGTIDCNVRLIIREKELRYCFLFLNTSLCTHSLTEDHRLTECLSEVAQCVSSKYQQWKSKGSNLSFSGNYLCQAVTSWKQIKQTNSIIS